MKIKSMEMDLSAVKKEQYPDDGMPQVAFVGRSNVGKSSTINSLLNRRSFARVSQNPGKTRTINFYRINKEFYLVDLPGYGYAKVSKEEKHGWGKVMETYLSSESPICRIYLLLDIRHEPKPEDKMMFDWIKHYDVPCTIIATKSDKISRGNYQKAFSVMKKYLQDTSVKIIPFSSLKKTGVEELWSDIENTFEESGYQITVE